MNCQDLRTWVSNQNSQGAVKSLLSKKTISSSELNAALVANRVLQCDREFVSDLVSLAKKRPKLFSQEAKYEVFRFAWSQKDIEVSSLERDATVCYCDELPQVMPDKPIHLRGQPFPITKEQISGISDLKSSFFVTFNDGFSVCLPQEVWKKRSRFFQAMFAGKFQESISQTVKLELCSAIDFFRLMQPTLECVNFVQDYELATFLQADDLIKKVVSQLLDDRACVFSDIALDLDLSSDVIKIPLTHKLHSLRGLNLRSLSLRGQSSISSSSIASLASKNSLERLDLSQTKVSSLEALRSLSSLQSLNIQDCKELSGDQCLAPIQTLPHLKSLKIDGCSKIRTEALTALKGLNLEPVTLHNMHALNRDKVMSLVDEIASLSI